MSSVPNEYLRHMLLEAEYIAEHTGSLQLDRFIAGETLKRAFVRSIEIIGEATNTCPMTSGCSIRSSNGALWPECAIG